MEINRKQRIAARMDDIAPFYVMDLLVKARNLEKSGRSVIHLEVGEPDFVTAPPVIKAGIEALEKGEVFYTPASGLAELREAISSFYQQRYTVDVPASRIVVTPGATGALVLALSILLNPGEEVLLSDPGYPCNKHFVRAVEGIPRLLPVSSESNYQLSKDQVQKAWGDKTQGVLVSSPSNPTGTLMSSEVMRSIADEVRERSGFMIVDEIYHGLTYGDFVPTALSISDDVFVVNSFSKYFGMTGWRVGWLVVPQGYEEVANRLAGNIFIAAATHSQYAAIAALSDESLEIFEQRRLEFRRRRDFLLPEIQTLGFEIKAEPEGAFYLYADCTKFTDDSFSFCFDILEKTGVAITPGKDFGQYGASSHVRFAYANSIENMTEALKRLKQYLQ